QKNLSSLLWWTRRVIAMRKNFKAFSRGSLEFLYPDNPKVLAFLRRYGDEIILVIVNLSRFAQSAELDLSRFAGCVPMEVFSRNLFRPIRKSRYVITLGPHAYYWFALQAPTEARRAQKKRVVPTLKAPAKLEILLHDSQRDQLEREILPMYVRNCRWFGSKARTFRDLEVIARRQAMKARAGDFVGVTASRFEADQTVASGNSQVVSGEQSNSSMLFDNKFFLKLYRKIEDGLNPDVEINRFLTEHTEFPN